MKPFEPNQTAPQPTVALVHDHPSTWPGGGAAIQKRLFSGYPEEALVYVSSFPDRQSATVPWVRHEYAVRSGQFLGRFGIGRIRLFLGCIPGSAVYKQIVDIFRKHEVQVVHAVAHEFLWVPAFFAARRLRIRYVLVLHDHWPSTVSRQLPRWFSTRIFGWFARRADAVLVSHEGMDSLLRSRYGVESAGIERDGLSTDELRSHADEMPEPVSDRVLRIGYAGMYVTYREELRRLREALKRTVARRTDFERFELVNFVELPQAELEADGWEANELESYGWCDYDTVVGALRNCSVLFLPMSFAPDQKARMEWGMPVKTTPYLRAARPLLVHAPQYASISGLVSQYAIGVSVTIPTVDALVHGLEMVLDETQAQRMESDRRRCLDERFSLDSIRSCVFSALGVRA